MQPLKVLYTIIREDLPKGVQIAQTAHAASEASGYPTTIVVALAVPNEAALKQLAESLGRNGLPHRLITEDAGKYVNQAMAIGIEPTEDRQAIRRVTSDLPLVK